MTRFDLLSLAGVTAVAALLRLPGLEARGRFDADQGHDMATLVAFTRDGIVPLLGPRTSVGEFHHGAFYYYLLAPASALSGGDPVAVTALIALLGIAAVALTWWLGRAIGGPVAGLVAGMLLAVSPAAIDESTFIWNPNPIGCFAALSLAAAWQARATGTPRWWALAVLSAGAVTQLHVLGLVFLIGILGIGLFELIRRRDRSVAVGLLAGVGLAALLFVPLLAHELQTGFSETGGIVAYITSSEGTAADPLGALTLTLLRVVSWPLVGLVTDVPQAAAILLAVVAGAAVLGLRVAEDPAATGVRWLAWLLGWGVVALALVAPSLQRVVPGLPNDHYHAFLDPVVVLLLAIPAGLLFARTASAWRETKQPIALAGVLAVGFGIVALELVELARKPPHIDPDGGWPAMRDAGARIARATNADEVLLVGLPEFKLSDAVGFPIEHAGGQVTTPADAPGRPTAPGPVVVACDRLFEDVIGLACGGPAEDAAVAAVAGPAAAPALVERFDASPRTAISIYRLGTAAP